MSSYSFFLSLYHTYGTCHLFKLYFALIPSNQLPSNKGQNLEPSYSSPWLNALLNALFLYFPGNSMFLYSRVTT